MKKAINKIWHEKHKIPMPSTLEGRVKWHEQHWKHCGCRKDMPKTIVAALKAQGKFLGLPVRVRERGRGAEISSRPDCFGKKFGFCSGDTANTLQVECQGYLWRQ